MAQPSTQTDRYLADFDLFEQRVAGEDPPWLRTLRREAIGCFAQVGFPIARRGNEEWKYTDVGPIARSDFRYRFDAAPALSPSTLKPLIFDRGWDLLVFLNGRYSAELSSVGSMSEGVQVRNLADAASDDPEALSGHLGQVAKLNGNGFTALSTAFIHDGAFISLSPGKVIERPIHLLYISTGGEQEAVVHPRTLLLAGKGSGATVVESYVALSDRPYFTNAITEVALGEGAVLHRYKLTQEGEGAYHVATTDVRQDRDSVFLSTSISIGGLLVRDTLNVALDAEGSECVLNGLYLTTGTQHVDNHTFIDHAKPHTTSRELYKGIADGKSTAVFNGRVLVRRDAQKTDASQTNKNLVLPPGAQVDTKPQLEIFADDVKCSHGATAGKLDESSLFYVRSRGLDEKRARGLLAYAFASEVVQLIGLDPIRDQVDRLLLRSLPSLQAGDRP